MNAPRIVRCVNVRCRHIHAESDRVETATDNPRVKTMNCPKCGSKVFKNAGKLDVERYEIAKREAALENPS